MANYEHAPLGGGGPLQFGRLVITSLTTFLWSDLFNSEFHFHTKYFEFRGGFARHQDARDLKQRPPVGHGVAVGHADFLAEIFMIYYLLEARVLLEKKL